MSHAMHTHYLSSSCCTQFVFVIVCTSSMRELGAFGLAAIFTARL